MSRATVFRKRAKLHQAAAGLAKISEFFMPAPKVPKPLAKPADVLEISSSSEFEESSSDSEDDWVDISSIPVLHSVTPISDALESDMAQAKLLSDKSPNDDPTPVSFLNPTADDEFEPPAISVGIIVAGLIKDAKKHKSFAALYKLHAVRNYLELHERYHRVPNIKNPAMRASAAVAKSVGKGPYFARQIRHLVLYISKFHTLPPSRAGKHQSHPFLLNNERVHQSVRRFLTVQAAGEVGSI